MNKLFKQLLMSLACLALVVGAPACCRKRCHERSCSRQADKETVMDEGTDSYMSDDMSNSKMGPDESYQESEMIESTESMGDEDMGAE